MRGKMETITFKHKSLEVKNVSPFMMTIIKMRNQRAEIVRAKEQRDVRKLGLRIDKEMRGLV